MQVMSDVFEKLFSALSPNEARMVARYFEKYTETEPVALVEGQTYWIEEEIDDVRDASED